MIIEQPYIPRPHERSLLELFTLRESHPKAATLAKSTDLGRLGGLLGALGALLGISWAPLGAPVGNLRAILRPQKPIGSDVLSDTRSHLGLAEAQWSHLTPSWTLQRVAKPAVQAQGRRYGEG